MSNPKDTPQEVGDASQYMRTYAKDMAALSAQQGSGGAPAPAPTPQPMHMTPPPQREVETTDGVTLPQVDESLITQSRMLKDEDEAIDLSDSSTGESVSIFEQKPKQQPTPVAPVTPAPTAPPPAPTPPPPPAPKPEPKASTMSMSPSVDSTRDSILARLKARAEAQAKAPEAKAPEAPTPKPEPKGPAFTMPKMEMPHIEMPHIEMPHPKPKPAPTPTPPPAPKPEVKQPEPVESKRPLFQMPKPEAPRPAAPIARPAPTPPPPPPAPKPEPQQAERFHSYSTDFADRIDKNSASTFSVLAAQSDSKPRTVVQTNTKYKRGMRPTTVLAVAFIVLGVGVASFGAFYFLTRPDTVAVTRGVPSLIEADETTKLEGVSGTELLLALKDASDGTLISGNVLVTYLTSASSTTKGLPIELPQPGGTLVKALPLQAPDILLRNIRPESTVGVVNAGTETRPFFILRVSSFERTFAGMLAWEPVMKITLSLLYPSYPNAPVVPVENETGTSTPAAPPPVRFAPTSFVDAIVRNYDVRILRDAAGRSLMLYGYKDKETLIIARDEAAFLELVTRLNASGE